MLYNSELASKYITESPYSKRTQAGIDLSVCKIQKIKNGGGYLSKIYKDKTEIPPKIYEDVPLVREYRGSDSGVMGWYLSQGVYSVTFNEGIKVPNNAQAKVTHRSSIYRIGNMIESPWWDAGFYCDNMNTTLVINTHIFVEENARLAQVVFWEMYEVTKTYDGQWQGLSDATHK